MMIYRVRNENLSTNETPNSGYLKAVRAEVEPRGVGVSILYPMGTIDTPANRESMPNIDPAAWLDPQAFAESMLFLVTRPPRGRVRELMVYGPS